MSVEVRPYSVGCNIACKYCYQQPMRDVQQQYPYMREKILAAVEKIDSYWSLFGGEALLLRLSDLEELLALAHSKHGHSGVQTNGNLITERHIELFTKYKTNVGISIDGPGELNDVRWAHTLEGTRKATARTEWAIKTLAERSKQHSHLLPSLIVTLHKGNCAADVFERFKQWFRDLDALGIRWVNLHMLEHDHLGKDWALSDDEYADRLIDLWKLQAELKSLRFAKFHEILNLLQGKDANTVCVWRACDPWNTDAVQSVEHDGAPGHCSRTNKDGMNWLPAEGAGVKSQHTTFIGHAGARHYERQLALYVTPQEVGGCKGCPFWLICQGFCPGTAEHDSKQDWRYKTRDCAVLLRLFNHGKELLNAAGIQTIDQWADREEIERRMYELWSTSQPAFFSSVTQDVRARAQMTCSSTQPSQQGIHHDGDYYHADMPHGDSDNPENVPHGDQPHGDVPHGDHQDEALN